MIEENGIKKEEYKRIIEMIGREKNFKEIGIL